MTAICPAGPPKVWHEMANHVLVASRNEMTSRLSDPTADARGGSTAPEGTSLSACEAIILTALQVMVVPSSEGDEPASWPGTRHRCPVGSHATVTSTNPAQAARSPAQFQSGAQVPLTHVVFAQFLSL